MAKPNIATRPTKPQPTQAKGAKATDLVKLTLTPVVFIEAPESTGGPNVDVDLTQDGFTEAPSGLAPTAAWGKPGDFVEGIYLGVQDEVGPNASRLYSVKMDDGTLVGLWGGTVLDSRIDMCLAQGLKAGDLIKAVYTGDLPPKPGRNPARMFKVGFKTVK